MPWSVKPTDTQRRSWMAVLLIAVSVAAAFAAPDVRAAPPTQQAGVSSAVKGEVDRTSTVTDIDRREALQPGSKVYMQDRVSSEPDSLAQLLLLDQSTFKLGPDSSVVIDEFIYDPEQGTGEMVVEAAGGVMRFVSGLIGRSNPDNVKINTPLGTLGVRGTMVTVSIRSGRDGQPEEALYVLNGPGADTNALARRGAIQVTAQGQTVTVQRSGWGTFVRPGQPPSPPQPIPSKTIDLLDRQLSAEPPSEGGPENGGIKEAVSRIGVDRLAGQTTATTRQRGDTANQVDQASQIAHQVARGEELETAQLPSDDRDLPSDDSGLPSDDGGLPSDDGDLPTEPTFTELGFLQTFNGLLASGPGFASVTQSDIPLYRVNDLEDLDASDVENVNFGTLTGLQLEGIDQVGSYDISFDVDFSEKTFAVNFNNISLPGERFGNISDTGTIPESDVTAIFSADGQVSGVTTTGIVLPLGTDQKALSGILSALTAETDPEVIGVGLTEVAD